jgi:hypothetical protein
MDLEGRLSVPLRRNREFMLLWSGQTLSAHGIRRRR